MNKIYFIILLFFISCGQSSVKNTESSDTTNFSKIDSIIIKTKESFNESVNTNKKNDTTINNKVEKTVQKIGHLETQVQQLKQENHELKVKLDDATDAGKPFHIRSISNDQKN